MVFSLLAFSDGVDGADFLCVEPSSVHVCPTEQTLKVLAEIEELHLVGHIVIGDDLL